LRACYTPAVKGEATALREPDPKLLNLSEGELLVRIGRQISGYESIRSQVGMEGKPDDQGFHDLALKWIDLFSDSLAKIICPTWQKRKDAIVSAAQLLALIHKLLVESDVSWPVDTADLAAFLIKRGLDHLCARDSTSLSGPPGAPRG